MDLGETGWRWGVRSGLTRLSTGTCGGGGSCCECGDEPSGSGATELASLNGSCTILSDLQN
jgi:hypothetical protein